VQLPANRKHGSFLKITGKEKKRIEAAR